MSEPIINLYQMPMWLQNQLKRAFERKDLRNLRMLNDCWFFYTVRNQNTSQMEMSDASRITSASLSSSD
jgi:hypothetical protein